MKNFTLSSNSQPAGRRIPLAAMLTFTAFALIAPRTCRADQVLWNLTNVGPVKNDPWFISLLDHVPMSTFPVNDPAGWDVHTLVTYHFNNGLGLPPGTPVTLTLKDTHFGHWTFPAVNEPGTFNWVATVNMHLAPGPYSVEDSAFTTWSYNDLSICLQNYCGPGNVDGTYGEGFLWVFGEPSTFPPPPPPQPKPTPVFPAPCDATTGAAVELAKPGCSGRPGSPLEVVVLQPLSGSNTVLGIEFKPPFSPSECSPRASFPTGKFAVTILPGPAGTNGLVLTTGTGTSAGSTFTTTVPPALCLFTGPGDWTLEVDRLTPTASTPTIGCYILQCP